MDLLWLAVTAAVSFEVSWAAGCSLSLRNPRPNTTPVPGAHARIRYR